MGITKKLRAISFCAGYGGIERGLELAGENVRIVAYSEIEAFACANLVAKMEAGAMDPAPIWTNLKTFPMERFRNKVDLLTGGFPCQPFSAAGARAADEDPRHLFPYFKRAIDIIRPRFVFLENVDGIASAKLAGDHWADPKGTPVLLHVCRELERLGYTVKAGLFSAREVGAPQKRRRWFIYGELADSRGAELNRLSQSEERIKNRKIGDAGSELAKPDSKGLESAPVGRGSLSERAKSHDKQSTGRGDTRCSTWLWPAPPGPYQHEWEEPRTVADTRHERSAKQELQTTRFEQHSRQSSGWDREHSQTEPQLGRTVDGSTSGVDAVANRVDRLRLCGNGVVPQTAAVAWITLNEEINRMKKVLNAHCLR